MKNDIVPYTTEEGVRLGRAMTKLGIPALGPQMGAAMLKHISDVRRMVEKEKLEGDVVKLLDGYLARISDICAVQAGASEEVLSILDAILKRN